MEYQITITEKDLKNRTIKDLVIKLMELKIREKSKDKYSEVTTKEYEFIKTYFPRKFVSSKKYAKRKKDLKYKGEVGKYLGKRLIIKEIEENE